MQKPDPALDAGVRPRTSMTRIPLPEVIDRLGAHYGRPEPPHLNGPWEMILWENVAYLVDDDRRRRAFRVLKKQIGIKPEQILSASDEALLAVTRHGIMPDQLAEKLRTCARIVLDQFDGDLRPVLGLPLTRAKKALQAFPGIGEPGAEKVLLLTRTHQFFALESNGLRVLIRLGFGKEQMAYSTTHRLIQKAVAGELRDDYSWLIEAHFLLRQHGQELCKRAAPGCAKCPLGADCFYHLSGAKS
jgi:endonuclease-3